ncbi:hypothetical protein MMC26_004090 [Xylographa opegraphella]|nr:hypothetical protein [Xylographa opegraphella]
MAKATDSAPAYEELYHNHPVNQHPPSGSTSAYAPVPLDDDPETSGPTESHTPLRDLNGTGHAHCEACDQRQDARDRRQHEKRMCGIVAATVMVAMLCIMILGIVFFDGWFDARKKSH